MGGLLFGLVLSIPAVAPTPALALQSGRCIGASGAVDSTAAPAGCGEIWTDAVTDPGSGAAAEAGPRWRLYLGMWTFHFRWQEAGIRNTPVLALSREGIFAGAFVNSFDALSFTAGYEDEPLSVELGLLTLGLGYRAGLLSGYDERLHWLAGEFPVIPLAQARIVAETRWVGFELAYAGIIATGTAYLRF